MKLKKEFITHNSEGEVFLVPVGGTKFSGLVKGNKTLGTILEQLKADTTEEEIVAALCEKYDAPQEVIAADVKKALDNLRGIGAIDE